MMIFTLRMAFFAIFGFFAISEAHAENGVVALRVNGCDYYLVAASEGFILAEWYGGYDPSRGDKVVGSFNTYGFKTLFFGPNMREGRVYIEDYWLRQESALEQLSEKCS
jgi:hypothetical protein